MIRFWKPLKTTRISISIYMRIEPRGVCVSVPSVPTSPDVPQICPMWVQWGNLGTSGPMWVHPTMWVHWQSPYTGPDVGHRGRCGYIGASVPTLAAYLHRAWTAQIANLSIAVAPLIGRGSLLLNHTRTLMMLSADRAPFELPKSIMHDVLPCHAPVGSATVRPYEPSPHFVCLLTRRLTRLISCSISRLWRPATYHSSTLIERGRPDNLAAKQFRD
jgi:hypothetical protein